MLPTEAGKILSDRSFATLVSIWRPGTEVSNNSFIIAMLESENLPLLNYPQLQEAISEWLAEISELNERTVQLAVNEREALRAISHHSEVITALTRVNEDDRALSGQTMIEVREDKEVMASAWVYLGS